MKVGVLQVDGSCPYGRLEHGRQRGVVGHVKPWSIDEFVEAREVDDESEAPCLLWDQENVGKEARLVVCFVYCLLVEQLPDCEGEVWID